MVVVAMAQQVFQVKYSRRERDNGRIRRLRSCVGVAGPFARLSAIGLLLERVDYAPARE
jgi:hypothetical protein